MLYLTPRGRAHDHENCRFSARRPRANDATTRANLDPISDLNTALSIGLAVALVAAVRTKSERMAGLPEER